MPKAIVGATLGVCEECGESTFIARSSYMGGDDSEWKLSKSIVEGVIDNLSTYTVDTESGLAIVCAVCRVISSNVSWIAMSDDVWLGPFCMEHLKEAQVHHLEGPEGVFNAFIYTVRPSKTTLDLIGRFRRIDSTA